MNIFLATSASGVLRSAYLQLLISLHKLHNPHNHKAPITKLVNNHTLLMPEVIEHILPPLILSDLQISLPLMMMLVSEVGEEGNVSCKRKRENSPNNRFVTDGSLLYQQCIDTVSHLVQQMENSDGKLSLTDAQCIVLVKKYLVLSLTVHTGLPSHYQALVSHYPVEVVTRLVGVIGSKLLTTDQPHQLYRLLHVLVWFMSLVDRRQYEEGGVASPPAKRSHLTGDGRGSKEEEGGRGVLTEMMCLAFLPFVGSINLQILEGELNTAKLKKWIEKTKNKEWLQDPLITNLCLKIICCCLRDFAPNSRLSVIIWCADSENIDQVSSVALHLPLLVYNLRRAKDTLCGHVLNTLLSHSDAKVVALVARGMKYLLCCERDLVSVRLRRGIPATYPHVLSCSVCEASDQAAIGAEWLHKGSKQAVNGTDAITSSNTTNDTPEEVLKSVPLPVSSDDKYQVSPILLQKAYSLLHRTDANTCVGMLRSMPAFMQHGRMSSQHLFMFLRKILHNNQCVRQAVVDNISYITRLRLYDDPTVSFCCDSYLYV